MAFLDNAGTIIIDAILTDIGRKRMAQGNFRVAKFALGDDEIDYRSNWSSTAAVSSNGQSGDGENVQGRILSQSLWEALPNESAVINYGLTSYDRLDLLYLPVLKENNKIDGAAKRWTGYLYWDGASKLVDRYFLSVNLETTQKILAVSTHKNDYNYVLENDTLEKTKLVIESGIDNEIARDEAHRDAFLLKTKLLDNNFIVHCDDRFVTHVLGCSKDSIFKNNINGDLTSNFNVLQYSVPVSLPSILDKFNSFIVNGVPNLVLDGPAMGGNDRKISAIAGPRASVTALNLKIKNELCGDSSSTRDVKYTTFGKTDQTLFGGTDKYDFIDTAIYVEGVSSRARILLPIRIIRYAGT